ncbi:MAG: 2Fe-2S iron-sulfur cluster-binding protein [Gammaproteobacteria bacterium]|nr:2Fe-2S iron-sulfur cluster-binding protein [Gammaproteobacteria bacterium]
MSTHELQVAAVVPETEQAVRVRFAVPAGLKGRFDFEPGQYLTLTATIAGEELTRAYSICSLPGEPLEVGIKHLPDGRVSGYANRSLAAGDRLPVAEPQGLFTRDPSRLDGVHYLCIAAGSGITPILSITRATLDRHPGNRVTLLYGNKTTASMMFRDALMFLKNRYMDRLHFIAVFSEELQDNELFNGRINNAKGAEFIKRLLPLESFDDFFLCGPESMVSEVARGLRGEGVARERIHVELFSASAEDAARRVRKQEERASRYGSRLCQVAIRFQGRRHRFDLECDGENLLDRARALGIELPFSCKDGVCATCKARLLEGQVDMDVNHALTDEEVAAGYILSCQSHPLPGAVSLDFDA